MLEIILIIWLSKKIGTIAVKKGHKPGGYKAVFVILWIIGEISGAIIVAIITNDDGLMLYLGALLGAAGAAMISFTIVNGLSDKSNNEMDQLFSEDLTKP